MKNVTVVIGSRLDGQAIARRVSAGKHVLLADLASGKRGCCRKTSGYAGFDVNTANVDVSSREAALAW
jgi:hypothetical protein